MGTSKKTIMPAVPLQDSEVDPSIVPDDGILKESVCNHCEARAFPPRAVCIRCLNSDLSFEPLPEEGTLYSYSTIHVSSADETPYTLGYVDLPDGVRVLARITGSPEELKPDTPANLVIDEQSWSFSPSILETNND